MKEGKHANRFHQTQWYQMYNDEILPDLLVKIEAGNTDLIPVFAKLCGREDLKTAADCRSTYDAAMAEYEAYLKELFKEKHLP